MKAIACREAADGSPVVSDVQVAVLTGTPPAEVVGVIVGVDVAVAGGPDTVI